MFRLYRNQFSGRHSANITKSSIETLKKVCNIFKVNKKKITPERHQWHCYDVFRHIITLDIFHTFSSVSIVEFEQVNVSWVICSKPTIEAPEQCVKYVQS